MRATRVQFSKTSGRSAAAVVLCLTAGLIIVAGPTKALGALFGAVLICLSLARPMIGMVIVIFANTSFQVLGSSPLTGFPVSVSKLFGVITVGSVLLHVMFMGWRITASPLYRPMLVFLMWVLIGDFVARNAETSFLEGTNRLLMMLLLTTSVATLAGQSQKALDLIVVAISAAIAFCGLIGLAEHFLPSLALQSDDPRLPEGAIGGVIDSESLEGVVIKRITGGIGDANWLAYTVAIAVPLLIYCWHRFTGTWWRVLILVMGGLQLIALVFSYTRTGFLGLGVAGLYLAVRGVVPLRPLMFILALGFCGSIIYLPPGLVDRMFSAKYLKEGSTPLRTLFFDHAVDIWLEEPIAGHGYKGFGDKFYTAVKVTLPNDLRLQAWAEDMERAVVEGRELVSNIGAHNLQLEILVEYGLIGFVLYFGVFVMGFIEMRRVEIRGPPHLRVLAIAISAGMIAFLVCGLLGHAKYLKIVWLMFGVLMAVARISRIGDSSARNLLDTWQAK
ncbi:O-antigen ligase family protein [Ruegeria marina]|uniref:O-antigen ligase family protein n=1 Tax=Ruegeria marina TaxID=639004 RepID=UPI0015A205C8|nr:O-antigen ligase family protein [Ruegeria marina]